MEGVDEESCIRRRQEGREGRHEGVRACAQRRPSRPEQPCARARLDLSVRFEWVGQDEPLGEQPSNACLCFGLRCGGAAAATFVTKLVV